MANSIAASAIFSQTIQMRNWNLCAARRMKCRGTSGDAWMVVVAWFVIGQATAQTRKALARAGTEVLHAPPLLQIELASALVELAHRRKIPPAAIDGILTEFEALDLVTDRKPPSARTIASTCRRHALSAYDAAYFELAMRLQVPLAAKDGPLAEAARKAGIAFA